MSGGKSYNPKGNKAETRFKYTEDYDPSGKKKLQSYAMETDHEKKIEAAQKKELFNTHFDQTRKKQTKEERDEGHLLN